jgi:hypothetical protein
LVGALSFVLQLVVWSGVLLLALEDVGIEFAYPTQTLFLAHPEAAGPDQATRNAPAGVS